jgi:tRNA nucleotidyltransferase (CCA-adding enzyme)
VPIRFAVLAWPLAPGEVDTLAARLRAPNEVRELGVLAARYREKILAAAAPAQLLDLLKRADAFRRPERFADLLEVARLAAGADTAALERARLAASKVDAGAIAAGAASSADIPRLVDEARLKAIQAS